MSRKRKLDTIYDMSTSKDPDPLPDRSVLDPFRLLLSSASSSTANGHVSKARKVQLVSSDAVKKIQVVRSGVEEGMNDQKTAIHELVSGSSTFPIFSSQSRTAVHISTRHVETLSTLAGLSTTLASTTRSTQPLLNLLERRSHWEAKASQARGRATILKGLRSQVDRLQCLDKRIRNGEGSDVRLVQEVLEEVGLGTEEGVGGKGKRGTGALNKGKAKELAESHDEAVMRGSKAWKVLNNRAIHLQSLLQSLLEDAYGRASAFEADTTGGAFKSETARMQMKTLVSVSPTQSAASPVSISSILKAITLVSPSLLPQLLKKTNAQLLDKFVRPVLASDLAARRAGGGSRMVVRVERKDSGTGTESTIRMESVATDLEQDDRPDTKGETRVFSCLSRLLDAIAPFYNASGELAGTAVASLLATAHSMLVEAISREVLDSYLIPSMPKSPERLSEWAERIKDAVSFEKSLQVGSSAVSKPVGDEEKSNLDLDMPSVENVGIIQDFYENKASRVWVMDRRQEWFDQLRTLVCEGWKGWDAMEVKRERGIVPSPLVAHAQEDVPPLPLSHAEIVDKAKSVTNASSEKIAGAASPDTAADMEEKEPEEDGGWSFDAEWESPETPVDPPQTESEPSRLPPVQSSPDENETSGWDLEESGASKILPPLADTEEEAPIVLKKPTRVAKRLGKSKGKAVAEVEQSEEVQSQPQKPAAVMAPARPMTLSSTPTPPPPPPPIKREDTSDWGWDNAEPVHVPVEILAPKAIPAALLAPTQPSVIIETCTISTATSDVLSVAEYSLQLSISISPSLLELAPFSSLPPALHQSAREVFELYRALMPIANKKEVEEVPSLSAQFVNDCEELARGLSGLEERYNWDGEGAELKLRILGEITHRKQIQTQQDALLEILDDLNGFEAIADEPTFEGYMRTIGQIRDKVEVLHRVWLHVMLPQTCLESTGSLLDVAIDRITTDVLAIQDITAEDSERLNRVCGEMRALEGLFGAGGEGTSVVNFVPRWLKFCYVSELLEASLADIRYLHDSGALVDFTKDELVHLIEALFTDSPLRTGAIERIVGDRDGGADVAA